MIEESPAPHQVVVPVHTDWVTNLVSVKNVGIALACVIFAMLAVKVWNALPKWVIALGVVVLLLAAGVVTLTGKGL